MSIFDKLKQGVASTGATNAVGTQKQTFTFSVLPECLAQMQALPEAALKDPFQTAALTVYRQYCFRFFELPHMSYLLFCHSKTHL